MQMRAVGAAEFIMRLLEAIGAATDIKVLYCFHKNNDVARAVSFAAHSSGAQGCR
jgi:hypothetical protein